MPMKLLRRTRSVEDVALIGIQRRGVPLAKRIAQKIEEIENVKVPLGVLDITFYRDDLSLLAAHPVINGTDIGFQIEGKKIVLVDDVITQAGRYGRQLSACLIWEDLRWYSLRS